MHLGDFGIVEREVEASAGDAPADTFTWYGQEIRIRDNVSPYNLGRFERKVLDPRRVGKGGQVVMEVWLDAMNHLETWIHPEDFDTFDRLAEENEAEPEDLSKLLMALYEALVGRPTKRSTASSDGRSTDGTTAPSSGKSSSSSRDSNSPGSTPRKRTPAKKAPRKATPAKARSTATG